MSDERYLGDGVYASFDGFMIWLDTRAQQPVNRIALEPAVLAQLERYVRDMKAEMEASEEMSTDETLCANCGGMHDNSTSAFLSEAPARTEPCTHCNAGYHRGIAEGERRGIERIELNPDEIAERRGRLLEIERLLAECGIDTPTQMGYVTIPRRKLKKRLEELTCEEK